MKRQARNSRRKNGLRLLLLAAMMVSSCPMVAEIDVVTGGSDPQTASNTGYWRIEELGGAASLLVDDDGDADPSRAGMAFALLY